MSDVDQFLEYYPEFSNTDLDQITTSLSRASVFIKFTVYGEFYTEALLLQAASFLYSSDLIVKNKNGFVTKRDVDDEYSVTYESNYDNKGKLINPYQQQLDQLNNRLGIGLGMILDI